MSLVTVPKAPTTIGTISTLVPHILDISTLIAPETNGPSKLYSTGDGMETPNKHTSCELKACYQTSCSNIFKLAYSPHNTLIAAGVASSSPLSAGITGISSISNNSMAMNKPVPNMGLSSSTANQCHNPGMPVGFTKIFINGTGNN